MSEKTAVYYYGKCWWDVERALHALANHYSLKYKKGNRRSFVAITRRAYLEYHGIHWIHRQKHAPYVRGDVEEFFSKNVVPLCIQREVFTHCERQTEGFNIMALMGFPPYDRDLECPRPIVAGKIATAFA